MPTVGWIVEAADERFWENRRYNLVPPGPVCECTICNRNFESLDSLKYHLGLEHPLESPTLMLWGRPLDRETVIRRKPEPHDFLVTNCSRCRIFETRKKVRCLSPDYLSDWLCDHRPEYVEIELENERIQDKQVASVRYKIIFRIVSPELLDNCDRFFIERLAVPRPTLSDVEAYRKSISESRDALEYGGALADYVVGILLKEQAYDRGVRGGFEGYKDKLMSSLNILKDISRPVAHAIVSLIQFNLNAWRCLNPPSRMPDLKIAVLFFRNQNKEIIHDEDYSAYHFPKAPICPIDTVTECILKAVRCIVQSDWDRLRDILNEVDRLQFVLPISEYDRVKLVQINAVVNGRFQNSRCSREVRSTEHMR